MTAPADQLGENLGDVRRLLEIHTEQTGAAPGRRSGVEVLHKSGVVLLVACWEAFVEDCASEAFRHIAKEATLPAQIPPSARKLIAQGIKADPNHLSPWSLAGDAWRAVLTTFRDATIAKYVSPLNTPKHKNVDGLFADLLDVTAVSACWKWHRQSADASRKALDALITLRGDIAHRAAASEAVTKKDVTDALHLVETIGNLTSNAVRKAVHGAVGSYPWDARTEPGRPGRPSASQAAASPATIVRIPAGKKS